MACAAATPGPNRSSAPRSTGRTGSGSCNAGDWALQLARAGIVARALVLFLLAVGVIRAGLIHRASVAGGMDASLVILNSMPQGPFLLGATAAGLLAYGVYQFLHARFATV